MRCLTSANPQLKVNLDAPQCDANARCCFGGWIESKPICLNDGTHADQMILELTFEYPEASTSLWRNDL
jgi:hypothetical protein